MALEQKHNINVNSNELRQICSNLLNFDLFNDNIITHETRSDLNLDEDINPYAISPPLNNCNYEFDLEHLREECISANLSLMNFNIRSLRSNYNNFTNTVLYNNNTKPSFITLTETWTDTNTNPKDYQIIGYHQPIIQNRTKNKGGGVALYITDDITNYKTRPDLSFNDESNNCMSIELVLNKKVFILTAVYRSPSNNNTTFMKKFEGIIDKIRQNGHNSIIAGDFNYNLINYKYHSDTETLYNIFSSSGYQPMVTKPTRITTHSSTLIDHIWTNYNKELDTIKTHILVTDVSDHLPVLYIDKGSKPQAGFTYIKYNQINDRNIEQFIQELVDKDDELNNIIKNTDKTAEKRYDDLYIYYP